MGSLVTAPGVKGATLITYVNVHNVMKLLGCKENTAYETIRQINDLAEKLGYIRYRQGKANKYLFADKFGIPIEVVNSVIEMEA